MMTEIDGSLTTSKFYGSYGKRVVDLVLTIPFILLLFPFALLVGASVGIFLGRPILFVQRRPGRDQQPFCLIKFRTMIGGMQNGPELQLDSARLTRFGKLLRSTSLDEIPELINVLKGDMSLVGPRPLLMQYLDRYAPQQQRRHEVLPGITGWAQVNGRNSLPWQERFELDVWYVDHFSFLLDLKILLKTIWGTLKREGITEPGHTTMSEFLGEDERSAGTAQACEKRV